MRRYTLCKLCFAVIGLLFLLTWAGRRKAPPPEAWEGALTAVGTVGRIEEKQNEYGTKQIIISLDSAAFCSGNSLKENNYITQERMSDPYADRILCRMAEGEEVPLAGEKIVVSGEAEAFRGRRNPGGFDAAAYYRGQGFLFSMEHTRIIKRGERYDAFGQTLHECGRYMRDVLEAVCGEDTGVMQSILLGDKTALSAELRRLYQKGGISHILAVSGLHISFLGLGLYRLLKRLCLPVPAAGVLAGGFLFSYVAMTGGSPSALRAAIMFAFGVAAEISGRSCERMTALAVSALILTLRRPLLFWQSGFLLSYGAILGLELVSPILLRLWDGRMAKLFVPGVSVSVVTLPVILSVFFEFPLCSLALNVLVIPLMGMVMALGLSSLAAGMVSVGLGKMLFVPVHLLLLLFRVCCETAERIPWNMWVTGAPGRIQLCLYGILLICFCLTGKYMTKPCALLLLAGAVWIVRCPLLPEDTLTVLDVGQGDGIVIQGSDRTAVLVDGGSTSGDRLADDTLLPYLKSRGIRELSYVFLTHMDADHINGVEALIREGRREQLRIDTLVLPAAAERDEDYCRVVAAAGAAGIRICTMEAGERLAAGGFCFRCLHPRQGAVYPDRNGGSLVLYVTKGKFSALLTGDLDGEAERAFTERYPQELGTVTLLKAGHHGSGDSCTELFLAACSPRITVISCGENNRYGHPDERTVERITASGSRIYVTKDTGAVEIVIGADRVRVRTGAGLPRDGAKAVAASKNA